MKRFSWEKYTNIQKNQHSMFNKLTNSQCGMILDQFKTTKIQKEEET